MVSPTLKYRILRLLKLSIDFEKVALPRPPKFKRKRCQTKNTLTELIFCQFWKSKKLKKGRDGVIYIVHLGFIRTQDAGSKNISCLLMHPGSGELDALCVGSCHIGQTRSPLQCYWPQSSSSGCNPSQYKSPRLSRENEVDPIDIKFVSVFLWICGVIPSEEKYLGLLRT